MFIAVLFVIIMNWKWPKCPSTGGWINKWWHTLTITKMVLGNKKNEQLMHKTTLINSKNVTLGQVLSICSAQAQSSSPSTLNKALLGSSHTHSFPYFRACLGATAAELRVGRPELQNQKHYYWVLYTKHLPISVLKEKISEHKKGTRYMILIGWNTRIDPN